MRVDPSYINNLVGALDNAQSNQQQLTSEMSSGVRVTSLSQDPMASGENVRLLNQIQEDDSFTQTTNQVSGQLNVADSALGQVVTQLTSAISLATSANNGTLNSSDEKSISSELAGIRSEVLVLANSDYQGQYIFAGGQSSSTPFSLNSSTSPATVTYSGDSNINYLQTPDGQNIQLNVPGNQIFQGSGANNVFTALNNLVADYASGTVNVGQATTDLANLNTALNYVSQQRVTVDNSITQLSTASTAVTNEQTQLTGTQTTLMQADVAQLSTQLSLNETQQAALEAVIAKLGTGSLFDKLPG